MFSAAEICQQEIEHALAGIPNTRNIIIGGCYTDELRLQTEEVFKQLREKNLIVNPRKCKFLMSEHLYWVSGKNVPPYLVIDRKCMQSSKSIYLMSG